MNTARTFRPNRIGLVLAAAAAAALVAFAPAASAQSRIGIAAQIKNQVSIVSGNARTLNLGSDVFAGERIRTGQSSTAQLTFLDQTNLTIGSQSEVVLDRFVFDPARGAGNVALSTTQGALRFISGAQNPNTYKIDTPVATIAIRGTLAYAFMIDSMAYLVNGYGHVEATLKLPGNPVVTIPPGYALVLTVPIDPANPQGHLVKWELGLLDLDVLQQLLRIWEDQPDGGTTLAEQLNAGNLPPFMPYECDCSCSL
jgi:hypothetical protein